MKDTNNYEEKDRKKLQTYKRDERSGQLLEKLHIYEFKFFNPILPVVTSRVFSLLPLLVVVPLLVVLPGLKIFLLFKKSYLTLS